MNLDPDELKREIDDTLGELDRLEAEVVELFGELLGEDAARRVADYMRAKERDPGTEVLRRPEALRPPDPPVRQASAQAGSFAGTFDSATSDSVKK